MNCLKNKKSLIVNELHPRKCTDKKAEQLEELIDEKSYLLSGELATKLTGRYIEFEMSTLSFNEYIEFQPFQDEKSSGETVVIIVQ